MSTATDHRSRQDASPGERDTPHHEASGLRRLSAEVVGTYFLVIAAAGTDMVADLHPGEAPLAVRAVAPALVVAAMIYALGAVSGAHFNPAVTLAFAVRTVFPWRWVPPYLAAELAGAIAAAATLQVILDPSGHQGTTYPHGTARQSLAVEALLTTLLVVVALSVAARHRLLGPTAPIAVAATIAAAGMIGISVSGASMNPARSLGPAIAAHISADQWIYVAGPLIGACVGALIVTLCQGWPRTEEEEAAEGEDNR